MDQRKQEEQEFHNKLRSDQLKKDGEQYEYLTSNKKFYSIDKINKDYVFGRLKEECPGKKSLDYCCGYGEYTFLCARYGAQAHGIDISDVTIGNCQRSARENGLEDKTSFSVMDAESLTFPDNYFDVVTCMGVLHHLNFERAMQKLARVVKPSGKVICTEPLAHNPIIQYYRRKTPHLRTAYETEHIIRMSDIKISKKYFNKIETRYYHLTTLAAVPFRNKSFFNPLLKVLNGIDRVLLSLPLIKTQAWMIVFELSEPKK